MTDEVQVEFGKYLRNLLDDYETTPRQLANNIGVDVSLVRYWLRGKKLPGRTSNYPQLIAIALNLDTRKQQKLFAALIYSHDHDVAIELGLPPERARDVSTRTARIWLDTVRSSLSSPPKRELVEIPKFHVLPEFRVLPVVNKCLGFETNIDIDNWLYKPINVYFEIFSARLNGTVGGRVHRVEIVESVESGATRRIRLSTMRWVDDGFLGFVTVAAKRVGDGEFCQIEAESIIERHINHLGMPGGTHGSEECDGDGCIVMDFSHDTPRAEVKSLLTCFHKRMRRRN